jgi:hypothetical protein
MCDGRSLAEELKKMTKEATFEFVSDDPSRPDEVNVYVVWDGVRIAKRKRGGGSQWVSLEPEWVVTFSPGYERIYVEHNGVTVQ